MKSVVIYTYFNSEVANFNLSFFIEKEVSYKDNIDYIIVINGFNLDNSIILPKLNNLYIIRRPNIGYDFGGHAKALEFIDKEKKIYDYYFFMNSSVIGPIIPHYLTEHWSNFFIQKINDKVKLVGTSIVCLPESDLGGYGPKVESFFFMTDSIGLDLLKKENSIFINHSNFINTIINGEYGISRCILKNGYSIDSMIPLYQNIDWTDKKNYSLNNNKHPTRKNSFYGYSLNPYELIFYKCHWKDSQSVNTNIINQYIKNY